MYETHSSVACLRYVPTAHERMIRRRLRTAGALEPAQHRCSGIKRPARPQGLGGVFCQSVGHVRTPDALLVHVYMAICHGHRYARCTEKLMLGPYDVT